MCFFSIFFLLCKIYLKKVWVEYHLFPEMPDLLSNSICKTHVVISYFFQRESACFHIPETELRRLEGVVGGRKVSQNEQFQLILIFFFYINVVAKTQTVVVFPPASSFSITPLWLELWFLSSTCKVIYHQVFHIPWRALFLGPTKGRWGKIDNFTILSLICRILFLVSLSNICLAAKSL